MSLPRETLMDLMALADGELEGSARARVEKLVAEDEEAQRIVDAMRGGHVAAWLREAVDEGYPANADVADAVMARLEEEPAGAASAPGGGGVVRLARVAGRGRRSTATVVATVLSGLALAAGVAMYLGTAGRGDPGRAPVASVAPGVAPGSASAPATPASVAVQAPPSAPQGVEVDEVDSPSRGVSVFEIPLGGAAAAAGQGSPSSVVIWIDDDPGRK